MRVTIMKIIGILTTIVLSSCWGLPTSKETDKNREVKPNYATDPLERDYYDPWAVQAAAPSNMRQRHRLVDEPRRGAPQALDYGTHPARYNRGSARPHDYDPFYYSNTQSNIVPVGSRSRRNSKYISNHLLNEDVHFFRRDPNSINSVELERVRDETSFARQRKPLYDRRPEEFYASSARPLPLSHRRPDVQHLRGSSRLSSYEGRSYYPPQSNHLDHQSPFDGPRYHGQAHGHGHGHAHGRESPRGETIDGWSVQVGTQLRVHDDGRSRNPGQFYVRDEKPHNVRRYPHREFDYVRRE